MLKNFKYYLIDQYRGTKTLLHSLVFRNPPAKYSASKESEKPDVILVQGIAQKWNVFRQLGKELAGRGYRLHIIEGIKRNMMSVSQASQIVDDCIQNAKLKNAVVIGHSKGGLIGKYLLAHKNNGGTVKKVIAISTPFGGTFHAKLIPGKAHNELLPDSVLLTDLAGYRDSNKQIVCVYGKFDNLINPLASCNLNGAKNIQVEAYGHHSILFNENLGKVILNELDKYD